MKGLWPFFLAAAVLMLASGALFYFGVTIWAGIAVGWLGFGLLCYNLFLQVCQPTPRLIKKKELSTFPDHPPAPFSIWHVPIMVLILIPTAIFAPFLMIFVLQETVNSISRKNKWQRSFPNSTKMEIREFLKTLVRAFGYPVTRPFWVSPDEKLLAIYKRFYWPGDSPDKDEIESFAQALKKRYNIDFVSSWREDMTVGELYALAKPGV